MSKNSARRAHIRLYKGKRYARLFAPKVVKPPNSWTELFQAGSILVAGLAAAALFILSLP